MKPSRITVYIYVLYIILFVHITILTILYNFETGYLILDYRQDFYIRKLQSNVFQLSQLTIYYNMFFITLKRHRRKMYIIKFIIFNDSSSWVPKEFRKSRWNTLLLSLEILISFMFVYIIQYILCVLCILC